MAESRAKVATINASKYLQQLCKHWSHRFTVRFDPQEGHIDFGEGQSVELSADPEHLAIVILDSDASRLDQMENVVADHIKRFAFRETLEFDWKRGEPAA